MSVKEYKQNQARLRQLIREINDVNHNTPYESTEGMAKRREKTRPLYDEYYGLKEKQIGQLKKRIKYKQRFYFKTIERPRRTYGGMNVTADIYKQTRNKGLVHLGQTKWQTASYRGEESEVLNEIVKIKKLPKAVLDISESPQGSGGYYMWSDFDKLGVKISKL